MLRPTCLAMSLLFALPALACGPAPHPLPAAAKARACAFDALLGEWTGEDGTRIRILDSRDRGFTLLAVQLQGDGSEERLVYSQLRLVRDCQYSGRRHVQLDEGLHPAPPHRVMLTLDPATGLLADDYHYTTPLRWRRARAK